MSAASDALRILIDTTYPNIVDGLNQNLTSLNDEKAKTVAEAVTINDGVLDGAETSHLALLEAKRVANLWDLVYTFGNYGITDLTEWNIQKYFPTGDTPTYINPDGFSVSGASSNYAPNGFVRLNCGVDGIKERQISSVAFFPPQPPPPPVPPPITDTIIALVAGDPITSNLVSVEVGVIVYSLTVNWDSDVNILADQNAFVVGLDQLTKEPDLNGTYGLLPRIDQIDKGIALQTINRNKYSEFIIVYEPYATP